jgi:hypothetical protein
MNPEPTRTRPIDIKTVGNMALRQAESRVWASIKSNGCRTPVLRSGFAVRARVRRGFVASTSTHRHLEPRPCVTRELATVANGPGTTQRVEAPEAYASIPPIDPQNSYDIVIIGAGNAGLALACTLCERSLLRVLPITALIAIRTA